MVETTSQNVIIIGAGVGGLTLAHGLKKQGIPFQIFERDGNISARGQGWAITIHWGLPYIRSILDSETMVAVDGVQVDPAIGRNDTGTFHFINLSNCETKFRIPPLERRRINREKLRQVLLKDIADHVHWSKRLTKVEPCANGQGVEVFFEDNTSFTGTLVVGADGANSTVRKSLCPETYRNHQLPIRFVGSAVDMTEDQVAPLRKLDPLLFQGVHPETSNYMWVSMLEVPEINGTAGTDHERYRVQINLSWPVKSAEDEVKSDNTERIQDMKSRAASFAPVLRDAVNSIPDDSDTLEIKLRDWPCLDWDNAAGTITLIGDAAHAMTMYRGEAANHAILDACNLVEALKKVQTNTESQRDAINQFEQEMRHRTSRAVILSREACIGAHDWNSLNENSPVVAKREIGSKAPKK